ncbi:hypothetical protein JCM3775_001284 [Rhodotorula graminis]|uniref:4'-phosphopantetheinyl transferase domain-containing protein n=1 Tax=Rhodotorula graminis (strain WP1) TaxID=578459 RepID=A0A194S2D1_RHOGW|nr:uncharacterized protein RHOBADRAFT_36592 [Rhodotorula graminis WP1]KPV74679.1 hypothetical protein RHOBADRAFT_36592 [Rhodotorula graminis WP1]
MLVGVGVDLVHLARVRSLCSRRTPLKLASRILSTQELDHYTHTAHTLDQQHHYLALRWAAKEAAYKALYPHCKPTWKDLAVSKPARSPKPALAWATDSSFVDPHLAHLAMHLSISHDNDHLVAFVVVEQRQP